MTLSEWTDAEGETPREQPLAVHDEEDRLAIVVRRPQVAEEQEVQEPTRRRGVLSILRRISSHEPSGLRRIVRTGPADEHLGDTWRD